MVPAALAKARVALCRAPSTLARAGRGQLQGLALRAPAGGLALVIGQGVGGEEVEHGHFWHCRGRKKSPADKAREASKPLQQGGCNREIL